VKATRLLWTLLLGLSLALALPLQGARAESAEEPSAPIAAPPAPPTAIPVAEVATRTAETLTVLQDVTARLGPAPAVELIRSQLPDLRERIDQELGTTETVLKGRPSLEALQSQQQIWQRRQLQTTAWLAALTQRATLLQDYLTYLADLRATWRHTRETAKSGGASGAMLAQIDTALAAVAAAEAPLLAQRAAVLDLQNVVGREVTRAGTALGRSTQAQQRAMGGILARDGPPLWVVGAWTEVDTPLPVRVREVMTARWVDIVDYARRPRGLALHLGVFAMLALAFAEVRRRVRGWAVRGEPPSPALAVWDRPYSAAVVLALLFVSAPESPVALAIRGVFVAVGLIAAIRVARPVLDPRLVLGFYGLWGLFALDRLRLPLAGVSVVEQSLLALEMLAGLVVLTYALRHGGVRLVAGSGADDVVPAVRAVAVLVMLGFAVSLGASVGGYLRLARLLASGILGSAALALILFAACRMLVGLAAFAFRAWPLRLLHMVQQHRDLLDRRVSRFVAWASIVGWILRTLDYVGLFQPARALWHAVMVTELGRGSIRVSVGSVVEFFVTVLAAYLLSAFIRFVLHEDVYPRTQLPRGMSYAISSLLNYVVVALGVLLALGILGLDLTKMTILVSAFGVGIGFGLQSVVNNFVSGLILLFERPIQVGDIVEVGDLSGEVSRIGIRASRVRTGQGAEIIVPNAQLVTERVTNWTLSDRTRRIDLRVSVDYGSAPEKVVAMLEAVARAHPQIMQTPAPQAVFSAFGESSIDFELRAWTTRFEAWPTIRTELAGAVHAALHAAGMSVPFPRREVRVLHDGAAGRATPAALERPSPDGAHQ
jgi:potassium efflux system protein